MLLRVELNSKSLDLLVDQSKPVQRVPGFRIKQDQKAKTYKHRQHSCHKRTAYTAFWTKAPPWEEKNIPKGTPNNGYEAKFEHSN